MSIKSRKTWLAVGATALLAGGVPGMIVPGLTPVAYAQTQKITGTVVDEFGDPIIGANIRVKGSNAGAITDTDGKFSVDAKSGATLEVSFIGYATQTANAASGMKVTLKEDAQSLDDVIVVGYGVQKKKLVTGATVQVKGEDLAKLNTSNALTGMQATTPGVNITQTSSQPGKGFKVNVRGMGTIYNSSPLLIIDGVNSGTADDGLNGLNPNDIESIDVLKDAASAAIYGSRAANGVILVTTKQGKAGKVTTQYDGFVGWSNALKRPATLNAKQYMQVIDETNYNMTGNFTNWAGLVPQTVLDRVKNGWEGTDWFDLYQNKNAVQHSHALSVTGGSDRSKFAMSFNYSNQEGIMGADLASNYERYGGRINSDHILYRNAKGRDVIKLGENLSFWYHKSHDLAESNGYWNIMQGAYKASPLVPAYDSNGELTTWQKDGNGQFSSMIFQNPMTGLVNGEYSSLNINRDFGVGATVYLEIEPVKNLKYRGQINTGFSANNHRDYGRPFSESNTNAQGNYSLNQNGYQSASLSVDNTLSYALPEFANNHIDVLVGQSFEQSLWSQGLSMNSKIQPEDLNSLVLKGWDYAIMDNFQSLSGHGGYDFRHQGSIASFFGRLNWNYDEKYMATVIFRTDGSSNFDKGNRWGSFPSVSAGWVLSNEKWMEKTHDYMDFLKLRASWGQNGNCNIQNFVYLSNVAFSPTGYADFTYNFNGSIDNVVSNEYIQGAYFKNEPNTAVTWETSEQLNVGLDARFLDSRLGLAFDWYKKTTKDWLVEGPAKDILGFEQRPMVNGGDVENTGYEIALSWNDVIGKDFRYHVNVNLATNKNEVTRLSTPSGTIGHEQSSSLFQNSSYVSLVEKGHAIGYFSGMEYDGIWQTGEEIANARANGVAVLADAQAGDPKWIDYDGNGTIDLNDRHEIGNPHPDVTLGVNLGFDWKGLDFSIQGSGAFGMQVMQCYRTALLAAPYENYTTDVFDRWHGAGTSNTQPRLTIGHTNDQWVSNRYMQDADYFKIQNVTLGYDLNKLFKKSVLGQLRIYVQAQNLYTFTGYTGVDPEVGSSGGKLAWARGVDVGLYPTARTFIVGASIKF